MDRNKIVFIAGHIEPALTGGEQYNLHLIAAAETAGLEVICVSLSDSVIFRWLNGTCLLWRACRFFACLWLILKVLRYRNEALLFDVWLAHLLWPGMLLVRGRYRVIVHHLSANFQKGAWRRAWWGFCEARLLRGAAQILTVSRSSKHQVDNRTFGKIPVHIINTAFEPVQGITRGGDDVIRMLFVGHITRAKGVIDLVKAVSGLPADINWRLDMVGRDSVEPDTTAEIESIFNQAGLQNKVTLHGRVDDEALMEMYLCSDIFVLPSYWEGYGIVLLEAMSHRLAVVASNAGAIPEVVSDGETGLLTAPGDVDALRGVLHLLLENTVLRDKLAGNGLEFSRQHSNWNDLEVQCVRWWQGIEE